MHAEPVAPRPPTTWLVPGLALPEGLEAGLIGGFAVVGVFFARDALLGEPMHTPSVLGALFFEGLAAAREVRSDGGLAAAYNAIHFTLWVILGFVGSRLMREVERAPELSWLRPAALLAAFLVLCAIDLAVSETHLARPQLWAGGLIGLAAMSAFLVWRHPAPSPGS